MFVSSKNCPNSKTEHSPLPCPTPVPPIRGEGKGKGSVGEALGRGAGDEAVIIRNRGTHQAHVIMGARAYAADDPRRWALYLLNNIIGGPAMNSLLCLSLRERYGLVYTVESTMTSYSDAGMWSVYFGCDAHDVERCIKIVRRELDKLMQHQLTDTKLKYAKRQLQGQLAIACDNREQYVIDYARTFLHTGRRRTLADVMSHVQTVTSEEILQAARDIFNEQAMTTLIYR